MLRKLLALLATISFLSLLALGGRAGAGDGGCTGQPFPEILRQRIFQPLGMVHTEHLSPSEPEADLVGVVYSQNEPGPYSGLAFVPGAAVSLALAGL